MKTITLLLLTGLCAGCTSYQALYEGIQNNANAQRSPTERAQDPAPNYDQYDKERKRVVEP